MSIGNQGIQELKLAIVGGGGVGKSSITIQYIQNKFLTTYDPTIEDSYRKHTKIDDIPCFLELLDTAGQEEYKALRHQYMRKQEGFLVVYNITMKKTFLEMQDFIEQILNVKDALSAPVVIVGNKKDLEDQREISGSEIKNYIKTDLSWEPPFIEVSAKTRDNIDESFDALVREVRKFTSPEDMKKQRKKCLIL